MIKPSWIHLESDHSENHLDQDLVVQDLFHGKDIGWLSQMTTLIREYAKPGDLILDPFCGLGTTLIAAGLLGYSAKGIEIDSSRISLTKNRLAALPKEKIDIALLSIEQGDARSLPLKDKSIDLVLTSVPYFGAERSAEFGWTRASGQLYFSELYEEYLSHMETIIQELARVLKPGGRCVLVAENVRNRDGHFFPMAWDLGRIMGFQFELKDERIIIYPHQASDVDGPHEFATDRRHEYVLVGVKS